MLIARRNDVSGNIIAGLMVGDFGATSDILLKGVSIIAEHQNALASGDVYGVHGYFDVGSKGNIHLDGCKIFTSKAAEAGTELHLWQADDTLSVSPTTQYDTALTSGTITRTGVADILADTDELQTAWENGGRLDLLLDAVPTTDEFNDRTLLAASYFDWTTDTVARVTLTDTVTSATGVTLAGTALGLGPTAMVTNTDGIYRTPKGSTVGLYKRVRIWDGSDAQQADITSITYSIYALDPSDEDSWTVVTGHEDVAVSVAATIYDTLQTDSAASDYNFKYIPVISTNAAFTDVGTVYLVEFTITPAVGEVFIERFRVTAR